jgi:hypothetical protein
MIAADDGIFQGNFNLADIAFFVALILFIIAFVVRLQARAVDAAIIAAGLACIAFGYLVL